MQNHVKVINI